MKKFRAVIFLAALLWGIALVQIIVTRVAVSQLAFTQAFARNQVTVLEEDTKEANKDLRNTSQGNHCVTGSYPGKLNDSQKKKLAEDLFQSMGGGCVMEGRERYWGDYYVAYGYTSGIRQCKKVNGKRINMNVAISYDEEANVTKILMGTPLINTDF